MSGRAAAVQHDGARRRASPTAWGHPQGVCSGTLHQGSGPRTNKPNPRGPKGQHALGARRHSQPCLQPPGVNGRKTNRRRGDYWLIRAPAQAGLPAHWRESGATTRTDTRPHAASTKAIDGGPLCCGPCQQRCRLRAGGVMGGRHPAQGGPCLSRALGGRARRDVHAHVVIRASLVPCMSSAQCSAPAWRMRKARVWGGPLGAGGGGWPPPRNLSAKGE